MSKLIQDLRENVDSGKYSRQTGLRAICSAAKEFQGIHGGPDITYDWLRRVVDGRIKNPGFERIEQLQKVMEAMKVSGGYPGAKQ